MNYPIIKPLACLTLSLIFLSGCKQQQKEELNSGINLSYIDSSANPHEDFYSFCNGKWQKTFQLPENKPSYGLIGEMLEKNLNDIKLILDEASKNTSAAENTDEQRLRDFYSTAMDSTKADKLGFKPIEDQLAMIDKVKSLDDFFALKNEFDLSGVTLLFGYDIYADAKDSRKNSFYISQGGYGLEDRGYYYISETANIQAEYKSYLAKLFTLINVSETEAKKSANRVFDFEKKLNDKAFTTLQLRDPEKQYNIYSPKTLQELAPAMKWDLFFKSKNISPDTIIVAHVEYIKALNSFLTASDLETLKLYVKAQLLMAAARFLSTDFEQAWFTLNATAIAGIKKMRPRWQRIQRERVMKKYIGNIVAREYVKKHFSPEAKTKVNTMIDNLIVSFRERIASRTWLSDSAKLQANRKLDLLSRKIGYPDKWEDFTGLEVKTDSYWKNICRVNTFETLNMLSDLKKPVDLSKWPMTAATFNANYEASMNEIAFTAAILQPPFFDPNADDAANYGLMGSIIGHELTHGFDNFGSLFDAEGNMKTWWTKKDFENFKNVKQKIIEQFDNYVLLDSLHVNGELTQGENIADLGGVTMSYYAYKKSLNGKPSPIIDGFTGEQRFFIAWTQGNRTMERDEFARHLLKTDEHSPSTIRAYAPLTNLKEFYEAFGVKQGDKMFTTENKRVEIW